MNLTIGGWFGYGFLVLMIALAAIYIAIELVESTGGRIAIFIAALFISIGLLMGFNWYYTSTASGSRAVKTQQSNLDNGIQRTVTVYSATGEIIKKYEGKFDVEYDDDRILFDDEKGLRHVIYYPTGTVVIDEVATD